MKFSVTVDGEVVTACLPSQDELDKFAQALQISGIDVQSTESASDSTQHIVKAQGDWRDVFRGMSLAARDEPLPPDQT